jgi:hypothetical protein
LITIYYLVTILIHQTHILIVSVPINNTGTARKQLKDAEKELAIELQNEMKKELASLDAHQMSERDDINTELNNKYQTKITEFKDESITQFKSDIDEINARFDDDCNNAKKLFGNLFGDILQPFANKLNEMNNVAYIVRIQQEYSDMHASQIKTATTLAEMAREASRLRRDLRESKRAQLLAARARVELPSLICESTKNRKLMMKRVGVSEKNGVTNNMLLETNRRLVNKLNRMSNRYADLEDEFFMTSSMRMSSLNADGGDGEIERNRLSSHAARLSPSAQSRRSTTSPVRQQQEKDRSVKNVYFLELSSDDSD